MGADLLGPWGELGRAMCLGRGEVTDEEGGDAVPCIPQGKSCPALGEVKAQG